MGKLRYSVQHIESEGRVVQLISYYGVHNLGNHFAVSEIRLIFRHAYQYKVEFVGQLYKPWIHRRHYYPHVVENHAYLSHLGHAPYVGALGLHVVGHVAEGGYHYFAALKFYTFKQLFLGVRSRRILKHRYAGYDSVETSPASQNLCPPQARKFHKP